MSENVAMVKSENFALRIIDLYEEFNNAKKAPFVMLQQILKSATSIGANLSEAICAISRNDFHSKVSISLKECSETRYWLRLLYKANYITKEYFESLYSDSEEIFKILNATTKTLSENKW